MDINLQTKIAELLKFYPQLEDKLIEISPLFSKLKNPVLRRTVAKVATLKQVAEMAGIQPAELVITLRKEVGLSPVLNIEDNREENFAMPAWLDEDSITIDYDAVSVIEAGNSPMSDIMSLTAKLKTGETMLLRTPFKPLPIMDKLQSKGFDVVFKDGNTYIHKPK
ncbi:MAG: DUF1858 domain-containing protein [Dysgonomonas sp.]